MAGSGEGNTPKKRKENEDLEHPEESYIEAGKRVAREQVARLRQERETRSLSKQENGVVLNNSSQHAEETVSGQREEEGKEQEQEQSDQRNDRSANIQNLQGTFPSSSTPTSYSPAIDPGQAHNHTSLQNTSKSRNPYLSTAYEHIIGLGGYDPSDPQDPPLWECSQCEKVNTRNPQYLICVKCGHPQCPDCQKFCAKDYKKKGDKNKFGYEYRQQKRYNS